MQSKYIGNCGRQDHDDILALNAEAQPVHVLNMDFAAIERRMLARACAGKFVAWLLIKLLPVLPDRVLLWFLCGKRTRINFAALAGAALVAMPWSLFYLLYLLLRHK